MDSIIKRVPDNTDYNMFEETKKMISNDKNDIIKRKAMEESVDRPNKKQCTSHFSATTSTEQVEDLNSRKQDQASTHDTCAFNRFEKNYPHRLVALVYQLELSILCLIRKSAFKNVTELSFKNSRIGHFNNILLCFDEDYICIKVLHVDTYYTKRMLNFKSLFTTFQTTFALNSYLNAFAEELLYYLENEAHVPKYLIIYTNCSLDITEDKKLKDPGNCSPEILQLSSVNSESDPDLVHYLFKNSQAYDLYRFANDDTRKRLSEVVVLSKQVNKRIQKKGLSQDEVIQAFFDCLILAVNQPTMEEMIDNVRNEISNNGHFVQHRKEVIQQLKSGDDKVSSLTIENLMSCVYSFNLFMFFMHEMFVNENTLGMKIKEKVTSHIVALNLQNRIVFLKAIEVNTEKLSLTEFNNQSNIFFIESLFSFFIDELIQDVDYLLIYTNASLPLVTELIVANYFERSEETVVFSPKFDRIDIRDDRYSFLKHPCVNAEHLYQLSPMEKKRILEILKVTHLRQRMNRESKIFTLDMDEYKKVFLDKIIFAVKQYNSDEVYRAVDNHIDRMECAPYSCDELYKMTLRYSMSYGLAPMTKDMMMTLRDDIRNNRTVESRGNNEIIDFAMQIIRVVECSEFGDFITFLTEGHGKECIDILKAHNINLSDISKIILGTGKKKIKTVFQQLFLLLFDNVGKTPLLENLENYGLSIENLSNMLSGAALNATKTLKNFYDLLFHDSGHPTFRLRSLLNEGITLPDIAPLLHNAGALTVSKFISFFGIWFDDNGEKKQSLKNLHECGINLKNVCSILDKSGEPFQSVYNLWFDGQVKSVRLANLEDVGINLRHVCCILEGSGKNVLGAFLKFYNLWFDSIGKKTIYLLILEKEKINLQFVVNILAKTGFNVDVAFKNFHTVWYKNMVKTEYLKEQEAKGRRLCEIYRLLGSDGWTAGNLKKLSLSAIKSYFDPLIDNLVCKEEMNQVNASFWENIECQEKEENTEVTLEEVEEETKMQDETKIEEETKVGDDTKAGDKTKAGDETKTEDETKAGDETKMEDKTNAKGKTKVEDEINVEDETKVENETKAEDKTEMQKEINMQNETKMQDETKIQNETKVDDETKTRNETKMQDEANKQDETKVENEAEKQMMDETKVNEVEDDEENERQSLLTRSDKEEIKQKLYSLLNLFPSWKSGQNSATKMENMIEEAVLFLNNPHRLNTFLQNKLTKKIINQERFDNIYSLIPYTPFEKLEVLALLNLSTFNREIKFAKIIFETNPKEYNALLKFLIHGEGKKYFASLGKKKINTSEVANIFLGCEKSEQVIEGFNELHKRWFEVGKCWRPLGKGDVSLLKVMISIIAGSGIQAVEAFKNLYNLWYDSSGETTPFVQAFETIGIQLQNIHSLFKETGPNAAELVQNLYNLFFDAKGVKTQYSRVLENEIDFKLLLRVLRNTGMKMGETFKELYNLWFDYKGCKTVYLQNLETCGVNLRDIMRLLLGKREWSPKAFKSIYCIAFDEKGNKQEKLKNLEKEIDLRTMMGILSGGSMNMVVYFNELHDLWFDSEGNKTIRLRLFEENGVDLRCIASLLDGLGTLAPSIFTKLFEYLFDESGTKTTCMNNIEQVIELKTMLEIVTGAGNDTFNTFKELYKIWFDAMGRKTNNLIILENRKVCLREISKKYKRLGLKAPKKFCSLSREVATNNF